MSALGSLVVKLALNHAEYTQGLSKSDQAALKFAQNSQRAFDRAERAAKQAFKNVALGAAGMVASFVGVNASLSSIKGIIDFQDQLGKLSQKTGLAVESLAGLDFAASQSGTSLESTAKGIRSFSRIVADSSGALNKNSEILRAMGVDLEALKSKTPEEQFFALADAVQDLGEQDRAVAVTSLLGDRMADLVPLLSGGSERLRDLIAEGQKYNPVTAESAARAEEFNDSLDRLSRSSGVLGQQLTIGLVSSLSEVAAIMATAAEQGGIMQGVLAGIGATADAVFTSPAFLKLVEFSGPAGALLANRVRNQTFNEFIENREPLLGVADATNTVGDESEESGKQVKAFAQTLGETDKQSGKAAKSVNVLTRAEQAHERETESLQRGIKRLVAAHDPLIERNERLAKLNQKLAAGLPREIFDAEAIKAINRAEDAINSTGVAVDDLAGEHEKLRDAALFAYGDIGQFGIQAARSIQTEFARSLSGTESDFERTFRNIAGQISSIAILGGVENIFNGKTFSGGTAQKDAGFAGLFSDLIGVNKETQKTTADIAASSEVTAAWLDSIGKNSKFSVSGATDSLTGAARAAFSNANPTAGALTVAGANVLGSSNTATAIAGAAATFGGPIGIGAGAAILALDFLDKKFGDFELGATGKRIRTELDIATLGASQTTRFAADLFGVPDIPTLILKAILGQGPFKFREETLLGDITAEGFTGIVNEQFRSKGSLIRGSRKDNIITDTDTGELLNQFGRFSESGVDDKQVAPFIEEAANRAKAIGRILDETINDFVGSLEDVADNIGLSKSVFDDFSVSVDLTSEKGKKLNEEQLTRVIADAADTLAVDLIPEIGSLAKIGESAYEAVLRVNAGIDALVNAADSLGFSFESARSAVIGLGFDLSDELVNKLGGSSAIADATNTFINGFLSEQERLDLAVASLNRTLEGTGVTAVTTTEGFRKLLEGMDKTSEAFSDLFNTDVLSEFLNVKNLQNQIGGNTASGGNSGQGVNNAFSALQKSVDLERNKLTEEYNESIKETSQSISTLTNLSNALKTATETINPLGLTGARDSIRSAIAQATNGNVVELSSVRSALIKLTDNDTSGFRTRVDFLRSQAENTSLLGELESLTNNQLTAEEQSLEALKNGFDTEIGRLDNIITKAQEQVDLLAGIDSSLKSLGVSGSLADFNTLSVAAGGAAVAGPDGSLPFNGNRNITGVQIEDFLAANDDPFTIYNAARANNVSALQLAANSPFSVDQINRFTDENNLPSLDIGTNFIPRDMPIFAHRGEEIRPKAFVDRDRTESKRLAETMDRVLKATEVMTVNNNKMQKTLDKWEKIGMPKERAA